MVTVSPNNKFLKMGHVSKKLMLSLRLFSKTHTGFKLIAVVTPSLSQHLFLFQGLS